MSYRSRIRFSASGETDSGLKFGAAFRIQDSETVGSVSPGTVFVEFPDVGRLTMGDADGAVQAAVSQFGAIGFDENNKLQEFTFLTGGSASKGIDLLYAYTKGMFSAAVSVGNPGALNGNSSTENGDDLGVGVAYTAEFWKLAAGYEDNGVNSQAVVSGSYGNGQADVKVAYGLRDDQKAQYVVYGTYIIGQTTLNAFYRNDEIKSAPKVVETTGFGATYDFGGGLALSGGYAQEKGKPEANYSLGLTMSF